MRPEAGAGLAHTFGWGAEIVGAKGLSVVALAPHVGLRESCHVDSLHRVTAEELLGGHRFDDCIARGSYRVDIHEGAENVLAPGRCLDCDRDAYGACRVMVNCNQMGEAAGRAAANALARGLPAADAGLPLDAVL